MYKPKTTFTGYKIGLQSPNTYFAIPGKVFRNGKANVLWGNKIYRYEEKDVVEEREFNDKFRPGEKYTLKYVLYEKK